MKRLYFFIFLLIASVGVNATMSYTSFYVQTTGANTNAGSTTDNSAPYSFVSGNWTNTTATFYKSGIDLSSVTTNMWASVYTDGATVTEFVAQITAVDDAADTITLSTTAKAGTNPTDKTGNASISIGGAWAGPSGSVGFPFDFATATLTNRAGNTPRINFKSGTTYSITAAITANKAGPLRYQGYTSSVGDGGKAAIDCAAAGASITLITASGANTDFADFIFSNTGATSGTSNGFTASNGEVTLFRVVVHDVRANGFYGASCPLNCFECEAYNCGKNGTASGGFYAEIAPAIFVRCISHDNSGANIYGFRAFAGAAFISCIADTNGKEGIKSEGSTSLLVSRCDLYNNGGAGVDCTATSGMTLLVENSNFIKNGNYGINCTGATAGIPLRNGMILNCGFGTGTAANTTGDIAGTTAGAIEIGSVSYALNQTPWSDPANGDFRITLAAAKAAGRGSFTETATSYSGTVGYPDIGAAQHQESASSGSVGGSYTFAQ